MSAFCLLLGPRPDYASGPSAEGPRGARPEVGVGNSCPLAAAGAAVLFSWIFAKTEISLALKFSSRNS